MIPEMFASAYLSVGSAGTSGQSESAKFIAKQIDWSNFQLQTPESYHFPRNRVLPELFDMIRETAYPGWDGYEARPISAETVFNAIKFVDSLPNSLPLPSVGAEPDGHITFEWYRSPSRVLSVSIGAEGDLHYAALVGASKNFGTEAFVGIMPSTILQLIQRVHSG